MAAALALARLGEIETPIRPLWRPETCPAAALPWLAWALSVDAWDSCWPEDIKRAAIAASIAVHRVKGTVGAVKLALASLGYTTRLIEWMADDPVGDPFTFRLEVDVFGRPVTDATYTEIERTALAAKNVRSHLTGIRAIGRVSGTGHVGGAALGGDTTAVYPWAAHNTHTTGPLVVGGAVASLDILTLYPHPLTEA